jgi:hypothetical protein
MKTHVRISIAVVIVCAGIVLTTASAQTDSAGRVAASADHTTTKKDTTKKDTTKKDPARASTLHRVGTTKKDTAPRRDIQYTHAPVKKAPRVIRRKPFLKSGGADPAGEHETKPTKDKKPNGRPKILRKPSSENHRLKKTQG